MAKAKIAITLAEETVRYVDDLVQEGVFDNRSQAIQQAVDEKLERVRRRRLARECAKLDPDAERELSEEGLGAETDWPAY
jgi:Arc/MetJ-type ribon-helix-helix transcriptional regulator